MKGKREKKALKKNGKYPRLQCKQPSNNAEEDVVLKDSIYMRVRYDSAMIPPSHWEVLPPGGVGLGPCSPI